MSAVLHLDPSRRTRWMARDLMDMVFVDAGIRAAAIWALMMVGDVTYGGAAPAPSPG